MVCSNQPTEDGRSPQAGRATLASHQAPAGLGHAEGIPNAGRCWPDDWFALRMAVCKVAPELDPPAQHWLESEASASYCRQCAIAARGKEFELGPLLEANEWYERDAWQDAFFAGIAAYAHRCAGESDITEACDTCGVTLDYWLTDYGIKEELAYWADAEMSENLSEIAYNLDRLFECEDEDRGAVEALAVRFLEHAATLPAQVDGNPKGGDAKQAPGDSLTARSRSDAPTPNQEQSQ